MNTILSILAVAIIIAIGFTLVFLFKAFFVKQHYKSKCCNAEVDIKSHGMGANVTCLNCGKECDFEYL